MAKADTTIAEYRRKRDFGRTREPAPGAGGKAAGKPIFVVQKHAARRLHWDFRLEHGGVLWSWAVPKGPSMDTADKRLAVHVEDHPLDYADFQGVIPAGNYGAGTVETWDRGVWSPVGDAAAGLEAGELKFELAGERLHGRFVLVRLKPRAGERAENWLLIKEHDGQERADADAPALESAPQTGKRGALPESQAPMLASQADAPPKGGDWLSEIKFDGYRLIVRRDGDNVRLLTRNGLDWTKRLPHVAKAVLRLLAETLLADGELVFLQKDGLSSFPDLQAALKDGHDDKLHLYLFDLLYRDGLDLRALALTERKTALRALVPDDDYIRVSDHLDGVTDEVRKHACRMGLEGIICKRADSPYRAGRGRDWLKIKCQGREEFVVLGWTPPQGSRAGLGALHLGFYDDKGALHYAGGCGSGFSDKTLRDLAAQLEELASNAPAKLLLTEEKPPAELRWVKPELVAEVQYTAWSGAGRLRHPVFLGLREDKAAADVVRAMPNPEVARVTLETVAKSHSGRVVRAAKPSARTAELAGVRLTHPDRELWPADGGLPAVTKQDLAAYWQAVANTALPGIAGRPLAFVRCPDGIDGEHFFQKHANRGMPSALHEGAFDDAPYLYLEGAEGLVATAQIAAVELHSWGSALDDPGRPDRLVFDLDPGEGVAWKQIITAAHDVKAKLEAEGFESFCRTSGGRGLHVVVPLVPACDWDFARAWSRTFAENLERARPDLYVASVPKARRRGKILIDWLRNGLGSTAIASFSPRARPHATVAVPVTWREVAEKLDPQGFTVHSVPGRLTKLRSDPWAGFNTTKQKLFANTERKRKHG